MSQSSSHSPAASQRGFTLLELLVVMVIIGLLAGYVAMAIIVVVGVSVAARLFVSPDDQLIGVGYLIANIAVSLAAALVGGYVAARLGEENRSLATGILAALVLAVGLAMERQTGQPGWYAVLIPVIGAAGVLLGGYAQDKVATGSN